MMINGWQYLSMIINEDVCQEVIVTHISTISNNDVIRECIVTLTGNLKVDCTTNNQLRNVLNDFGRNRDRFYVNLGKKNKGYYIKKIYDGNLKEVYVNGGIL